MSLRKGLYTLFTIHRLLYLKMLVRPLRPSHLVLSTGFPEKHYSRAQKRISDGIVLVNFAQCQTDFFQYFKHDALVQGCPEFFW